MAKKILIVEDEKLLAESMKISFERMGFEVCLSYDGETAFEILGNRKPDIILLDLILPRMSGFEVLERLKKGQEIKNIPVIVISALGQAQDRKRAIELGVKNYFVKASHSLSEIVEEINKVLAEAK